MTFWIQPYQDPAQRHEIPHAVAGSDNWQVDGTYVYFEGRMLPVGARGEHVTRELEVEMVWPLEERVAAEALLAMLRATALSSDGRLNLHLEILNGGTPIDMVVEVHEIPQTLVAGRTAIEATFVEVDS